MLTSRGRHGIGGAFPKGDEFNFRVVPDAAFYTVKHWPSAVMYVGFDVGQAIYTCGRLPEAPNNPIRRVYVDDSKNPGALWIGSNHGASIVKVEPLD